MRRPILPMKPIILGAMVALTGCTKSSLFEKLGANTYSVTTHILGTSFTAQTAPARNTELATNFCAETGRTMIVIDRDDYDGFAAQDRLKFRCDGPGPASRPKTGP